MASGKSLNLSELQASLLRNRIKITTPCLPGFVWCWEEVAEVAVVTLITVVKLVLRASCSGPCAEGAHWVYYVHVPSTLRASHLPGRQALLQFPTDG